MNKKNLATACLILFLSNHIYAQRSNWVDIAHSLGGSGKSKDGNYVRLIESDAWGKGKTQPIWIAFMPSSPVAPIRGSIPVLRTRSEAAKNILIAHLPTGSKIVVSSTFGKKSPRVCLRFQTKDTKRKPRYTAHMIGAAIEAIEPGVLKRIRSAGVVLKDTMECEEFWSIQTDEGEHLEAKNLAPEFQKAGARIEFLAHRYSDSRNQFRYFGGTSRWHSVVKFMSIKKTTLPLPTASHGLTSTAHWAAQCETHLRNLLTTGVQKKKRLVPRLASGFTKINETGYYVCPKCRRKLVKHWLFADSGNDKVDATLHSCARDQLYYFSHSGHEFGPINPLKKEKRK